MWCRREVEFAFLSKNLMPNVSDQPKDADHRIQYGSNFAYPHCIHLHSVRLNVIERNDERTTLMLSLVSNAGGSGLRYKKANPLAMAICLVFRHAKGPPFKSASAQAVMALQQGRSSTIIDVDGPLPTY